MHRAYLARPTALVARHSMLSSAHALTGGSRRSFTFLSAPRPTDHGLKVASHSELLAPTLHLSQDYLLSCLGGEFAIQGADCAESEPPPLHARFIDTALAISCRFSFAITQGEENRLQGSADSAACAPYRRGGLSAGSTPGRRLASQSQRAMRRPLSERSASWRSSAAVCFAPAGPCGHGVQCIWCKTLRWH